MKFKKIAAFSLLALMAGMSLASCQSSEDITYNSGFIKEKTTIDLWTIVGANNQTQLNNYIEKFKKLEPNVKINNVKQSTNYNGLASMASDGFATNNYPDLIQAYPDAVSDFMYYKKVVKLDPYMDNHQEYSGKELAGDYKDSKYEDDKTYTIGWSKEEKDDIVSEYLAEGQKYVIDGTYSVPFSKSTEAMFYNRDLLGKSIPGINGGNGLTEDYFNNLTWEELFDNFCPKFIEWNDAQPEGAKLLKSDQAYHAVFAYDSDDNLFITLGEQYGIPYTGIDKTTGKGQALFNNAEYKALLKKWNEYAKKGYIISKGSAGDNYTNEYFTARNTLFSVGSTGGVKYQFDDENPMDVGIARIPQPAGAVNKTSEKEKLAIINQGPSLCVLDHGDENRKLASWLFYKFMTNEENALDWAINSGYCGIRTSVLNSEEYKDSCDESQYETKTLDKLMARNGRYIPTVADILYTSPTFKGSSECRNQAGGIMTYVLSTKDMTDAALNNKFDEAIAVCNQQIG